MIDICKLSKLEWINRQLEKNNDKGCFTFKEVSNIIDYYKKKSNNIPNWYNKETKKNKSKDIKRKSRCLFGLCS